MTGSALPTAAQIVDALTRRPAPAGPTPPSEGPADIMGPILALHRSNNRQWEREDDARRDPTGDSAVAAAKRDIDRMNRARHEYIEAIDRAIDALLPPCDGAPLVTESPGMAIDRLSVLLIRIASTEARAAAGAADSRQYADRIPRLRSQLDALERAIARLFDDLEAGDRRFAAYESLKLYGGGEPGPGR